MRRQRRKQHVHLKKREVRAPHPCSEDITTFDKATLTLAPRPRRSGAAAAVSGLNESVGSALTRVLFLQKRARDERDAALAGNVASKRWGAWPVRKLDERLAAAKQKRADLRMSDTGWRVYLARLLLADLQLWQSQCGARLNAQDDAREAYVVRWKHRFRKRMATRIQALVRGHLSRALPEFVATRAGPCRWIRHGAEILWQALGEISMRSVEVGSVTSSGARANSDANSWERMRRVVVVATEGRFLMFDPEESLRLGENNRNYNHLSFYYAFSLPPDVNLGQVRREERPAVHGTKNAANKQHLPGLVVEPIVADDSGASTWLSAAGKRELSEHITRERTHSKIWVYQSSFSKAHISGWAGVTGFLDSALRKDALRSSFTRQMQARVACEGTRRLYFSKVSRLRRHKRQHGSVLARFRELSSTLEAQRAEAIDTRVQLEDARRGLDELTESEAFAYLSKLQSVRSRVDRSFRRRRETYGGLGMDTQPFMRTGLRVVRECALTARLRWLKEVVVAGTAADLGAVQGEAVDTLCRSYTRYAALKEVRQAICCERARRVRFAQSKARRVDFELGRKRRAAVLLGARQMLGAAPMQVLFRKYAREQARIRNAAGTLGRFARRILARKELARLAEIKRDNDVKMRRALDAFGKRTHSKTMRRWVEYTAAHKLWQARYDKLRFRMCTKLVQRNQRAFRRRKLKLVAAVLRQDAVLHPRLAQVLKAFQVSRDFDQLLLCILGDYEDRGRNGCSALVEQAMSQEEKVLRDAKRMEMNQMRRSAKRRWQVPYPLDSKGPCEALELVLFPYLQWPCVRVERQSSGPQQYIMYQFWRMIRAVNIDYWSYTRIKRRADRREHRRRTDEIVWALRQRGPAGPPLPAQRKRQRQARASGPNQSATMRYFAISELCRHCYALFDFQSQVAMQQSRCSKCGIARCVLEPKRNVAAAALDAADGGLHFDLFMVHAAFACQMDVVYEARMESLWARDPRAFLAFPGHTVRDVIVAEQEWWAAVNVARPWICRFKDAGISTVQELADQVRESDRFFQDWGLPMPLVEKLTDWVSTGTRFKPNSDSKRPNPPDAPSHRSVNNQQIDA